LAGSCSLVKRVPGGKTVEVIVEGGREGRCCVRSVLVAGDFFAFPGEAIESLGDVVAGCCSVDCVRSRVFEALRGVELVGVSVDDIVGAIVDCYCRLCGRECR